MIRAVRILLVLVVFCVASLTAAAESVKIRIGVLKFGTVTWEADVIRHHGLDEAEGIGLVFRELASKQATAVALLGGAVDMIVTDWFWVSRQRAAGADYTFVPYSTALGALVVPADSPIDSLADLRDRRLGIAGGPVDKSWLLLRALARKRHGIDLNTEVEKVFGGAPLLNEQIKAGRIDAVITFWPYAARLEAAGMRRLIGVEEAGRELGIASEVPLLGYVFSESWADAHRDEVLAFIRASRKAKEILRASDAEWERLKPLTRAEDEATLVALREAFRAGIPEQWGEAERRDARRMFEILRELGGDKLVGTARELQAGTFWSGLSF